MFKLYTKIRSFLKRKQNIENWAFEVVSYKRLQRDFAFKLNGRLAQQALKYPGLNATLDMIEKEAHDALKESLFLNARTIKRLN